MQAETKCIHTRRSIESSRSAPSEGPRSPRAAGGSRLPSSAFSEPFLAKLRLVLQLLDRKGAEPEPDTEPEAVLSGLLTVERVHGRGGGRLWAVVKAAHPEALAQVIESVGPEALPTLGRALDRRVEAALEEQEA